jgi:hypothetical protein
MASSQSPLFQLLVNSLPAKFTKGIVQACAPLYGESDQRAFKEPTWDDPEARYMRPQFRRSLFEAMFRRKALEAGLIAQVAKNPAKNYEYTLVRSGSFVIAANYVRTERQLARPALFRAQHASVNKFLRTPQFAFAVDPRMYEAGAIFAQLLHGPSHEKGREFGFLRIGIPSADNKRWQENFDFFEIHQECQLRENAIPAVEPIVDTARPKLKRLNPTPSGTEGNTK